MQSASAKSSVQQLLLMQHITMSQRSYLVAAVTILIDHPACWWQSRCENRNSGVLHVELTCHQHRNTGFTKFWHHAL